MEDQQEFQEEVLDFMGLGSCMPREAWSLPSPQPLQEALGLARRLPSLGVGAWRSAPLLPWRVQCPVRVCAALAAGSGGSGRYLVLCLPRFPLPAPRVPRCVWRVVPSGCPLPSLAGTPFDAVCAFRELRPVALLVVPACPLRVCALALPRRPLPPLPGWCGVRTSRGPGAGRWKGRSTWSVPLRVSCPGPLPRLACFGGGNPVPVPPYLAWGCPPPRCCGRGCVGVGAQHCPLGLHALWGLRAAGMVGGRPWGEGGLPLL